MVVLLLPLFVQSACAFGFHCERELCMTMSTTIAVAIKTMTTTAAFNYFELLFYRYIAITNVLLQRSISTRTLVSAEQTKRSTNKLLYVLLVNWY